MPSTEPLLTVTVTRSAGADGAVVVFIDGDLGEEGLRVVVNDNVIYARPDYVHVEPERPARSAEFQVTAEQVAYNNED